MFLFFIFSFVPLICLLEKKNKEKERGKEKEKKEERRKKKKRKKKEKRSKKETRKEQEKKEKEKGIFFQKKKRKIVFLFFIALLRVIFERNIGEKNSRRPTPKFPQSTQDTGIFLCPLLNLCSYLVLRNSPPKSQSKIVLL